MSGVTSRCIRWQGPGHGLGLINPALYAMEATHAPAIVDVTIGTNTVIFPQSGSTQTVPGFSAVGGYHLSTGAGTLNAALFVPELVAAVHETQAPGLAAASSGAPDYRGTAWDRERDPRTQDRGRGDSSPLR
jgi:hypothetical protein